MERVAITANRKLADKDYDIIFNKMAELVTDPVVEMIIFGGAIGGDTVALQAALDIICLGKPKLVVVVPCLLSNQSYSTHAASKRADQLIELGNPITRANGYESYKIRNRHMVDLATRTVAFWSGDENSGTYHAMKYSRSCNKLCEEVKIEGLDK